MTEEPLDPRTRAEKDLLFFQRWAEEEAEEHRVIPDVTLFISRRVIRNGVDSSGDEELRAAIEECRGFFAMLEKYHRKQADTMSEAVRKIAESLISFDNRNHQEESHDR